MTEITLQELEQYFEEYLDRVEEGETFLVKAPQGNVVLMPVEEHDEMVRLCAETTD